MSTADIQPRRDETILTQRILTRQYSILKVCIYVRVYTYKKSNKSKIEYLLLYQEASDSSYIFPYLEKKISNVDSFVLV